MIAESNTGSLICADEIYNSNNTKEENLPENLGKKASLQLLDEIFYSGFVDSTNQSILMTLMCLAEKKISSVKIGRISGYTI